MGVLIRRLTSAQLRALINCQAIICVHESFAVSRTCCLALLIIVLALGAGCVQAADFQNIPATDSIVQDDEQDTESSLQAAKDRRTVETLLRLPGYDIAGNPKAKASLNRYLLSIAGTEEYVDVVQRLKYIDAAPKLLALAQSDPQAPIAVTAMRTLVQLGQYEIIQDAMTERESTQAEKPLPNPPESTKPTLATIQVVGRLGSEQTVGWLQDIISDNERPVSTRLIAVRSLARSRLGERELLKLAEEGTLAEALCFTAADVLHASNDPSIVERVGKILPLPDAANETPLPPIAQLISLHGDASKGKKVFAGVGTCQKCHKVRGEGKEVGPDLSEIGSKLSPTALYESILDPNAAISHNYESFLVTTVDGTVVTGLLVSQTETQIVLKDAESVVYTIPRDDIEELLKQSSSLMPVGLQKEMSVDQLVDLVAFLETLTKQDD